MKKKILIVEDDESIRDGLADVLEQEGYKVVTAPNGEIGLERLWEDQPDLVILDLLMPVMDGFEFKKIMDSHRDRRAIPVIVFSAHSHGVPPEMKVAGVLDKSASMNKILNTVKKHL
jgi:DNA-binding response OmpR family regulator